MSVAKIAISIEEGLLEKLDRLIRSRAFRSRSQAIQKAVEEKLTRLNQSRLARECRKLNKKEEQALADSGLEIEEWPEY